MVLCALGSFPSLESHLDSLFKVVHVGPLATGVQALHLLYIVMEASNTISARYYRALYQKLLDPQLCVRSAQQVGGCVELGIIVLVKKTGCATAGYVSQCLVQVTEE